MRVLVFCLAIVMLFSLSVAAQEITSLRQKLNESYDELLNLQASYQEKEKQVEKLANHIKAQEAESQTLSKSLIEIEQKLEQEQTFVSKKQQALSRIKQQLIGEQASFKRAEQAAVNAFKLLSTKQQKSRQLVPNLKETAFLDYLAYTNGQTYAAAGEKVQALAEEQLNLESTIAASNQKQQEIKNKITEIKTGYQQLKTELSKNKLQYASLQQEANLFRRQLYEQEKQVSELERELTAQIGSTKLPSKRNSFLGWPLSEKGRISSEYGLRMHPIFNEERFHTGVDLAVPAGTPIKAAADGIVVTSAELNGYGLSVLIDHGQGISTFYGHASKLLVEAGTKVRRGQTIALVGSTGFSTGPHLHFEVRESGAHVNPWTWLQ